MTLLLWVGWGMRALLDHPVGKADLRVGGKWSSDGMGKDGKPFRVEGQYSLLRSIRHACRCTHGCTVGARRRPARRAELEPQNVHGLHPSGPRKAGTGTLVKIRHEGFAGDSAGAANHSYGWKRRSGTVERLCRELEKPSTLASRMRRGR